MEDRKKNIEQELRNLSSPRLNDEEKEFKKAFSKHFLGIRSNVDTNRLAYDYERIEAIRRDYPVMEFMNLFGNFDTIQKIDLDKLFNL